LILTKKDTSNRLILYEVILDNKILISPAPCKGTPTIYSKRFGIKKVAIVIINPRKKNLIFLVIKKKIVRENVRNIISGLKKKRKNKIIKKIIFLKLKLFSRKILSFITSVTI
tara:strand:- start:24 stop:362 length:339 start_codon:yes stop_codon:yes gene_type:complete